MTKWRNEMKMLKRFLVPLFAAASLAPLPSVAADACPPLLNYSFPRLADEKPQSLCEYSGKVLLVVNTASYCGFTKQYDGLEKALCAAQGPRPRRGRFPDQ